MEGRPADRFVLHIAVNTILHKKYELQKIIHLKHSDERHLTADKKCLS